MTRFDAIFHADAGERLGIYLNDHRAAGSAGLALARRCASSNADNVVGVSLRDELIPLIEDDLELLEQVRHRLDAPNSLAKQVGARAGELVGRLKLNGRLTGYSPLSRVIELESLASGIEGKRHLWQTLTELSSTGVSEFERRIASAEAQRDRVDGLHAWAINQAFDGAAPPDRSAEDVPDAATSTTE